MIKRCTTYCFEAKLKCTGKDEYYVVPFQILAGDGYTARSMLWKYLENPEQTGYKYETCVHLQPMPSSQIIMDTSDILNEPTADVVEVRHGEWKYNRHCAPDESLYYCSLCIDGGSDIGVDNYCPNCGAKMDGKDDKE